MQDIFNTTTSDGRILYGLLTKPEVQTDRVLINIHGTASYFYIEDFMPVIAKELAGDKIATLSTNNRGADALKGWEKGGASEEIFEDCLIDIDAWVNFVAERGYQNIVLQGHSLGAEKVAYYMAKGSQRGKVKAVILLAPADSFGTEMDFLKKVGKDLFAEAKTLVSQGKGHQFITGEWYSHAGVLPKSAQSFLNFFSADSELSQTLPFRKRGEFKYYQQIAVPILVIIGDKQRDEYTIIPIREALKLLEKENSLTKTVQITDSDHNFINKEQELANTVKDFVARF